MPWQIDYNYRMSIMKIILASKNQDKLFEFQQMMPEAIELLPEPEGIGEIEETGDTYEANALIKARTVHEITGGFVLSDDSGLSVDLLDGYPGIYSARFAGVNASYPDKIKRLWKLLENEPQEAWKAAFVCTLAFINPAGEEHVFKGELRGLIWPEIRGENGFGYDPIFYVPELGVTTAELSNEAKNEISHRGVAVHKFLTYMRESGLID